MGEAMEHGCGQTASLLGSAKAICPFLLAASGLIT
jgi:hypothetical protein